MKAIVYDGFVLGHETMGIVEKVGKDKKWEV